MNTLQANQNYTKLTTQVVKSVQNLLSDKTLIINPLVFKLYNKLYTFDHTIDQRQNQDTPTPQRTKCTFTCKKPRNCTKNRPFLGGQTLNNVFS